MTIDDHLREIIRAEVRESIRAELQPVLSFLERLTGNAGLVLPAEPAGEGCEAVDADGPDPGSTLPVWMRFPDMSPEERASFLASLPPFEPERWLTTREAAARLGLRPRTLEYWRSQRRGPAFRRVGALVRYDRAEIDSYMAGESFLPSGLHASP